jgi:hypothetical protein
MKSKLTSPASHTQALALSFFLIAVSASLPIMLSHEQRGFYLNTSMPFYALALACWSYDWIQKAEYQFLSFPKLNKYLHNALVLSLFLSLVGLFTCINTPKRDAEKLADMAEIAKTIYPDKSISVDPETWADWGLQNYCMRYHGISLDPDTSKNRWYRIPSEKVVSSPHSFEKIKLNTKVLNLHKRKDDNL